MRQKRAGFALEHEDTSGARCGMKRIYPTLVYFIKPCGLDGPIKIGASKRPAIRVIDLAAWSPWPLELIGAIEGTTADERFLHRCFADCHSHREWFHSTPVLREAIRNILDQGIQFARSTLVEKGSIRGNNPRSVEFKQRLSVRMKAYWVRHKEERRRALS